MLDEIYVAEEIDRAFPELSEEDQERVLEFVKRMVQEVEVLA